MQTNKESCFLFVSFVECHVGPDGEDFMNLEIGLQRSRPIILDTRGIIKSEYGEFIKIFEADILLRKGRFNLYVLSFQKAYLFLNLLNLLRRNILLAEAKLIDSYVFNCCNLIQNRLRSILQKNCFMEKVEIFLDIYIDHKLSIFFNSIERKFDNLQCKIKETAITVTETATESSATLGIESAAQALGQAAVGVGITIMVDIALTSHSLYRAKKAKDEGLIDAKQFETKVKKKVCESSFQFIGGTTGSVVGQIMIPIPVLGAFVGGLCGSLIGTGIGKGVNYGLFDREETIESEVNDFKLIKTVLEMINDRNPDKMITYIEENNSFEEVNYDSSRIRMKSLSSRNQSKFQIRNLLQKKFTGKKALEQLDGKEMKNLEQASGRRFSDSFGILRRKMKMQNNGNKLKRENSFSASCLDRCSEEKSKADYENYLSQAVKSEKNDCFENKCLHVVSNEETSIIARHSTETGEKVHLKKILEALGSFECSLKHGEKQKNSMYTPKEKRVKELSQKETKGQLTERSNPENQRSKENCRNIAFEEEIMAEKCDAINNCPGKPNCNDKNTLKLMFDLVNFGKLASFWKKNVNKSQNDVRNRLRRNMESGLPGQIDEIHKEGRNNTAINDVNNADEADDEISTMENDSSDRVDNCVKQNEQRYVNFRRDHVFLKKHVAYGEKMKVLVGNASNLYDVKSGKACIHSFDGEDEEFRFATSTSNTKVEKCDEKPISSMAKNFITNLQRNLMQKKTKKE